MANIQTIELRDEMFDNVRKEIKIATLRKGKRDYTTGKTILFGQKYCDLIDVTNVRYIKFSEITDADAQQEGYENKQGLIDVMKEIYTDITDETICTQVWFKYQYTFNT